MADDPVSRFALITGASSGFGLQTSIELARRNWTVFACVRATSDTAALRAEATRFQVQSRIKILMLDVSDGEAIRTAASSVLKDSGGFLDLLLNNAGYTDIAFFEDMSDAECRSIMETNFFGAVSLTRAVLPAMRAAGRGRIGFVSSNAVNAPHPTMTLYAASKWALEGFAEGLAMEVAPFGVEVVVVQPGNHRTPFGAKVRVRKPERSEYSRIWDRVLPGLERLGSIGAESEWATPEMIRALTDPAATHLTQIGDDTELFSRLKRMRPYEVRATLLRRFLGFPGKPHSCVGGK